VLGGAGGALLPEEGAELLAAASSPSRTVTALEPPTAGASVPEPPAEPRDPGSLRA
jgi:hypothetical protein